LFSGLRPDEVYIYGKKMETKKMRQQHTTYIQRICLFSGLRPDEVYKKKGNQKKMRQQHTTYIYTANLLDFGSSATGTEHKTIFFVSISFFAYVNVVNAFVRTYSAHALKRQYLRPQKRGAPHFIRAGV
jgi:hypothetical protein